MDLGSRSLAWALALVLGCALVAACKEDRCQNDLAEVKSCQREYRVDMCETPELRCVVHCDAKIACDEFAALDRGDYPEWLTRCWAKCQERLECGDGESVPASFGCDGSEDCTNGGDEQRCSYHVCSDGQRVRADAACDDYADCADGSDEMDCP